MPIYEYECENCKFYTEVMQKISDAPLTKCPSCGKSKLKKLISAPVFRLKGGGWYETDFKSDKENKRNLAVEKDSDGDSKSETKSTDTKASADAKPAASESKPAESKPAAKPSGSKAAPAARGRSAKPASRAKPAAKAKSRPAARRKGR